MEQRHYSLEEFAESKRSVSTQKLSRRSLRQYLLFVYPEATQETVDAYSLRYLKEGHDHFSHLVQYINQNREKAPLTLNRVVSDVRYWLRWNGQELSVSESARLKNILPRPVVITEDEALTIEKIRSILVHSDTLMRAFLLTLSSSGMRADELMGVRFSDMREEGGCRYFHIPAARMKARKPHDYRYSAEAYAAIQEWLKVRSEYVRKAEAKTRRCLGRDVDDTADLLFPLSYNTHSAKLHNALRDAKLLRQDETTKRYTIGFQAFRRWYDSVLKLHLPLNVANELVGHDEGLSSNYRRYPRKMLDDAYLSVEDHLRIFAPDDYVSLKGSMSEELKTQASTTAALAAELLRQREELDAMKLFIQATKKE